MACSRHNVGAMATARWLDDGPTQALDSAGVASIWGEVEAQTTRPVILVVEAGEASVAAVVGDPDGTVLTYFPADYAATGTGSLHSVGDPAAAAADHWEPPVTAYQFGHHTEFPRWSVVPRSEGIRALEQFCERPEVPPSVIAWEPD